MLFLRPRSQRRLSAELEALDLQGLLPDRDLARVSVLSTDSGIERDLPPGADELPAPGSPETERAGLQRKGGVKKRMWPPDISHWDGPPGLHRRTGRPSGDGELLPGVARLHTARVLVLGDDRMLGRLARAYHSLRWGPGRGGGGCWGRGFWGHGGHVLTPLCSVALCQEARDPDVLLVSQAQPAALLHPCADS